MLNAFYDLSVSPAKYDFIGFLIAAERHRQLTGEDGIRFIFVPGPNHGFREDPLPPQSIPHRNLMFKNIILPMCGLLGIDYGLVICKTRDEAKEWLRGEIFPTEYLISQPTAHYGTHVFMRAFQKGFFPLRAKPAEKQPRLITITLRESHYWQSRNSNRETWLAAAQLIKDSGLDVTFILDVDSPPLDCWRVDHEASTDLHRRASLYESAGHNFFVSNGPAWMAAAMPEVNMTVFKVATEQGAVSCSTGYWEQIGFPVGSQIGRDNHRLVWEDDTKDVVLPIVQEVINRIKNQNS